VGELAQLDVRALRLLERLADEGRRALLLVLERPARQLERDDRVDEALLGSVVEIADDTPPLVVGGGDDPRAGRGELAPRLDVRDPRRDQLGDRAARRQGSARSHHDHPRARSAATADHHAPGASYVSKRELRM
jgi:hypothetical protein